MEILCIHLLFHSINNPQQRYFWLKAAFYAWLMLQRVQQWRSHQSGSAELWCRAIYSRLCFVFQWMIQRSRSAPDEWSETRLISSCMQANSSPQTQIQFSQNTQLEPGQKTLKNALITIPPPPCLSCPSSRCSHADLSLAAILFLGRGGFSSSTCPNSLIGSASWPLTFNWLSSFSDWTWSVTTDGSVINWPMQQNGHKTLRLKIINKICI